MASKDEKPTDPVNSNSAASSAMSRIVVWALISFCSGSIGFGISQVTVVRDVSHNTYAITTLQKDLRDGLTDRKEALSEANSERQRQEELINRRVDKMTEGLNHLIDQNTQLISLIKAQNQILQGK